MRSFKKRIFLLLALTTMGAYSQNMIRESATSDAKRFQIGISLSPDICYRTLKIHDEDAAGDFTLKLRNEMETAKIGYTAGLNIRYNINDFVGLETGIQYANKGYKTKMTDVIIWQPEQSDPNKMGSIFNFHYIDVPIKATFTFGTHPLRFFTSLGVTANIFLKETETEILVYSDRTDKTTRRTNYDYNKINISPTIGIGIDYKVNSSMNVRVEPTFRYGARKIIDAPLTTHLYSGGLIISYYVGL
jgi:opacity protein-like surface antigen